MTLNSSPRIAERDVSLAARRGSTDGERLAALDQDEVETEGGVVGDENGNGSVVDEKHEEPVTWRSLPHRRQLIILTLSRLSEPLVQTSLQVNTFNSRLFESDEERRLTQVQAYMFYQLKSFNDKLPDSTIAAQAGLMASSFTGAQFLTAMMWGRISDSDRGGRKTVVLIGLFGTSTTSPNPFRPPLIYKRETDKFLQLYPVSASASQNLSFKPCSSAPSAEPSMGT